METAIWLGIFLCLSQSAILSGLNISVFSISKLELEVQSKQGDKRAEKLLEIRKNSNLTLVTILWANVGVNVLLALLSGSVLSGLAAFVFSTFIITIFAEILPQAYLSRHVLRLASILIPFLAFYRFIFYPIAFPVSLLLDRWLGGEGIRYFRERDLRQVIRLHMESAGSDIQKVEGQGALNFLDLDDIPLDREGEPVASDSIIKMKFEGNKPVFPAIKPDTADPFLAAVNLSGKSWVVLIGLDGEPRLVLRTDSFIREALFDYKRFKPYKHCHRPIVSMEPNSTLGSFIRRFRLNQEKGQDIVEDDIILLWGENPRIITGSDILGRLMRGIATQNDFFEQGLS